MEKTVGIPAVNIVSTKPVIDLMADVCLDVKMDLVVFSVFKVYTTNASCFLYLTHNKCLSQGLHEFRNVFTVYVMTTYVHPRTLCVHVNNNTFAVLGLFID